MALDERLQRLLEHAHVERAYEAERTRRVVRDAVVEDLAEQPEQLLREGERGRPLAFARRNRVAMRRIDAPLHQALHEQAALGGGQSRQPLIHAALSIPVCHSGTASAD